MKAIDKHIFEIDTEAFGHKRLVASYLVRGAEHIALIDPGFPSSASVVKDKLKSFGIEPSEISYILLTHFHIDHSGATGALLKEAPNARVIVHKRSAFYVKNFAKIVGGARMVFRTELIKRFGEAYPVGTERVFPVTDGEIIDLGGGVKLRVIHAPGHSPDNVCYLEESSGTLFPGDLACLQYPDLNNIYIPAASPPLFEINDEIESLRSLEKIRAERIMVPHYGYAEASTIEFVEKSINAIQQTKRTIQEMFREGLEFQHMIERLRGKIVKESGKLEDDLPDFLSRIYLREMLKTGLMGFLAFMLEYAPYPRGFTFNEQWQDIIKGAELYVSTL